MTQIEPGPDCLLKLVGGAVALELDSPRARRGVAFGCIPFDCEADTSADGPKTHSDPEAS